MCIIQIFHCLSNLEVFFWNGDRTTHCSLRTVPHAVVLILHHPLLHTTRPEGTPFHYHNTLQAVPCIYLSHLFASIFHIAPSIPTDTNYRYSDDCIYTPLESQRRHFRLYFQNCPEPGQSCIDQDTLNKRSKLHNSFTIDTNNMDTTLTKTCCSSDRLHRR